MKKYLLSIAVLMTAAVSFTSCSDDDVYGNNPIVDHDMVKNGVYVVNEGSYYSQINGALDIMGYNDMKHAYVMNRNIFEGVNGRSLGGTPNDAVIYDNKELCIAVTDENRVEFVNTNDQKSIAYVNIEKPRELAVAGNFLFVSSFTGKVFKVDMKSHSVVAESEKVGEQLEGIAVAGKDVYVCNSCNPDYTYNNNVVVLDGTTMAKKQSVEVGVNPTKIVLTQNEAYVLCMGNYYDVPSTVKMIKNGEITTIGSATMMAYDKQNERLYMVNAPYGGSVEYNFYDTKSKKTSAFLTNPDIYSPYTIAVDPVYGDVYITSLTKDPDTGYASYTIDGKLYRYTSAGIIVGAFDCGVCPGTVVCNSYRK